MRGLEALVTANGGDRWILDRIANGERIGDIAKDCVVKKHGPVSRHFLYRWRDKSQDRKEGWRAAMKDAGHAYAEGAGEVWDEVGEEPSSAEVAVARGKSEYKRWLAGRLNDEYRDGPQIQIGIAAAGDLHLDALRRFGSMEPYREPIQLAEVIEEEDT